MKKTVGIILLVVIGGLYSFSKFKTAHQEVQNEMNKAKRTLHLFAMSDYFPANVIKDFEEKNNCEVRYDNFSSNEELLAKLQAGAVGYDIIVPSDYLIRALIAGNLISPIDRTRLSNIKNISKDFSKVPYDPSNKFSVPYTWGTTGLIYNSKFVKTKLDSWSTLFEKQYAGHISLLDDEREVLGAMLHLKGFSTNTTNRKELEEAQKLLIKLKPNVRLFASDPKQHLLSGDIWIAHIYSGDAHQVMKSNPDLKYVNPKEGGVIWIDTMAIPQKAENVDLAYNFINNILDVPVAQQITEQLLYSSPNAGLESLLTDGKLKASHINEVIGKKLEFLTDLGAHGEIWDQLWTEAKSH